jgi:predicted nuclease of restriction endonuclease-like (RecB) superfamily
MPKKLSLAKVSNQPAHGVASLLADVRGLVLAAREEVARAVDSGLVTLYWHIGRRIRQDILKERRAEYGAEIVAALGRQLGWTHFRMITPMEDELKRDFYAEMCRIERWSARTLEKKIGGMLYERTALSRKPDKLIRQELAALREEDKLTPDLVFRDPYVLDFLGLRDTYAERDLEAAILREMEAFILELGVGCAFLERQKRITVDGEDHYLDLLFYHRHLRRLVVVDLKLREFKPGDKGQMEFYLRWLDRHERKPGEEAPIGLILCAGQRRETVELLDLEKSGIRVSSYWTDVLPKEQLQKKLHEAVRLARARLAEMAEMAEMAETKTSTKRNKFGTTKRQPQ